ncbi:aminoglycoside phosphotransferase family protein [Ruegeria sediminis]|uniref:Aminoglycoside phosphotransferase family protein n=1 Tax=Ruegeria sediminis TaxID=2583820 RepID=A0ABY2WUM7_9RHOB|nr:aminoglycoside phosphotransferase family protein [Ruegeria sediminis]TMV04922.1 aminoglycoside phosphotransferase family protein [Ruegeria sediminis]
MEPALSAAAPPPPALAAELRARGLLGDGDRFEALFGGRTNRVWKLLGSDSDQVLKLYCTGFRNPLFRNDAELEAACLRTFEGEGFAPRLRASGRFGDESWVLYDHAPGEPWRENPEPVARILRKVHTHPARIQAPKGCNGSADLAAHGDRILAQCSSREQATLEQLRPAAEIAPLSEHRLIHGDPVAGNILISRDRTTLIDWQCPALGDPSEDLALFLSPAMQRLYRGNPLSAEERERFLSAYDDSAIVARYRALRPWYAWRMAAYCLWRSENGAADYSAGYALELGTLRPR